MSDGQRRERAGDAPRRELDHEKTGQRAGTPVNLIRQPPKLPPMRRVQK